MVGSPPAGAADAVQEAYRRYLQCLETVAGAPALPVGQTPKDTVWTLNKARLYRYRRRTPARYRVPLLLVYALINKPYIFDLRPGRSFVEFLLEEGFQVFLLDWGSPGPEDRRTRFDDYAAVYLPRAVRRLLRVSGTQELSLLGYCIGGTVAAMHAALFPHGPVRNLVLVTAPLDYSNREGSLMAKWFHPRYFDVDRLVDAFGNVPADFIEVWSKMLKPVENFIGAYVNLWDRLDDPAAVEGWQAMYRWVHDGVPFAGEAFRQWVKEHVQGNRLVAGTCEIGGRPVRLGNIRVPLLTVVAEHDHIVPTGQSLSVMDLVRSREKQVLRTDTGHVGLMSGRLARDVVWPKIASWLAQRSGPAASPRPGRRGA